MVIKEDKEKTFIDANAAITTKTYQCCYNNVSESDSEYNEQESF